LVKGGSGLFKYTITEVTWNLKTTVKSAQMFRTTTTTNERKEGETAHYLEDCCFLGCYAV